MDVRVGPPLCIHSLPRALDIDHIFHPKGLSPIQPPSANSKTPETQITPPKRLLTDARAFSKLVILPGAPIQVLSSSFSARGGPVAVNTDGDTR